MSELLHEACAELRRQGLNYTIGAQHPRQVRMVDTDIERDPTEALAGDVPARRLLDLTKLLRVWLDCLAGAADPSRHLPDPISSLVLVRVHLARPL
ncbi:MAG TPA: hypothetical protein VFA08_05525 [Actinomycetota bacterium]|jgi:hypothetical protein|nr:hypothetical protein [Actinomycetota bacterium]